MKTKSILFTCLCIITDASAQMMIRDEHITHQQERMVFKSWDKNTFTPKSGFLGLNPLYWITWGLHPNYPDTDLRPLGPSGAQMLRYGLILGMSEAEERYKLASDTIHQTARPNLYLYSGMFSHADPLWHLYYRSTLADLQRVPTDLLKGLGTTEQAYLRSSGLLDWYTLQHRSLSERLGIARTAHMERGSRILYYHRLLMEYRRLKASWEDKKRSAKIYLKIGQDRERVRLRNSPIRYSETSDIEIADRIIKNSILWKIKSAQQ